MSFKELSKETAYQWWKNHRKVISLGLFLALFSWYINPVIKKARKENEESKSAWLVIHSQSGSMSFSEKIEMEDLSQCLEQGRRWRASRGSYSKSNNRSFVCLEGK